MPTLKCRYACPSHEIKALVRRDKRVKECPPENGGPFVTLADAGTENDLKERAVKLGLQPIAFI